MDVQRYISDRLEAPEDHRDTTTITAFTVFYCSFCLIILLDIIPTKCT